MNALRAGNLGLRFLLELAALAAVAYWGYKATAGATRWLLAVAAPLAVAGVWGMYVAPKAAVPLSRPAALAVEAAVWAAAALALADAGHRVLALAFALVAAASGTLNAVSRD